MNSFSVALSMLGVVFGGALLGLGLQKILPEHHLTTETKDVVRLATALIATLSALVLSLLVSSAKGSFDRFDSELIQNATKIVMLDRALDQYGPQTDHIRELLKTGYKNRIEHLFGGGTKSISPHEIAEQENIDILLLALTPEGPVQQGLKARAVALNADINTTAELIHAQRFDAIPTNLLLVLGAWLALIFLTFGLFAPPNAVVVGALLMCSMSVSGAVLLILEMHVPFTGLITLSSAPMQDALSYLGR